MNTNTINYTISALARAIEFVDTGIQVMHDLDDTYGTNLDHDIADAEEARTWLLNMIEEVREGYRG